MRIPTLMFASLVLIATPLAAQDVSARQDVKRDAR